ncbi:MAG: hypothetical protein RLZZ316_777 [Bacteroidota bacterium]|jgi:flagellar basal body-associated protein FliL
MFKLLGVLGTQELIIIIIILLLPAIGILLFFYWLGKRSGYRKGQLDMYKEREKKES